MNLKAFMVYLLPVVMTVLAVPVAASQPAWETLRIQMGSFAECHADTADGHHWPEVVITDIPQQQHFCLHTRVSLSETRAQQPQVFKLSMLAASRIYWNGVLIGENGQVGENRASEVPGVIDYAVPVPPELIRAGENYLLIKASSYHLDKSLHSIFYYLAVDDFGAADSHHLRHVLVSAFFMGGLLVAFLVFQILYWFYEPRISYQLISALCISSAILLLVEKWRSIFGYTYDLHILRLQLVLAMTYITCFLLVVFYLVHYRFEHKLIVGVMVALMLLGIALLPLSYDGKSLLQFLVTLVTVVLMLARAVYLRWRGARWGLLGMTIVSFLYLYSPDEFLEDQFALASFVVVIVALLSIVSDMRQRRIQALTSVRMEAELLRKNLQPHFLMNSLTLAIEWIEQAPEAASRFVQTLAEELGILVDFSSKRWVPLDEEIHLCRKHIEVMNYRYNASYSLVVEGLTTGIQLPPAVIHTQIENAFSHNRLPGKAEFRLSIHRRDKRVSLQLTSPLASATGARKISTGFGERYIHSRLQENFDNNYGFTGHAQEKFWVSIIEFEAPF